MTMGGVVGRNIFTAGDKTVSSIKYEQLQVVHHAHTNAFHNNNTHIHLRSICERIIIKIIKSIGLETTQQQCHQQC